jgi:DNA-binding MarR family transcriptional regulator
MADVLAELGYLFLGSRLKRLAERMQADAAVTLRAAGMPIQPSHTPLLAALDTRGPMTVGETVAALGVSQPAVTRSLASLVELGLAETAPTRDQRQKRISLTPAGAALMAQARTQLWPHVEAAARGICEGAEGSLLDQIAAVERALAAQPLYARVAASRGQAVAIRNYEPALAGDFYQINAEWIESMFAMEPADREVLEDPEGAILAGGGAVLFAEAPDLGVIGTVALRNAGDGAYELTKMGVLAKARGRKAGELLLAAAIARAAALGAETLYLLTNRKCEAAIHLYEKAGFVHDAAILARYAGRYARSDVAMRYPWEALSAADAAR